MAHKGVVKRTVCPVCEEGYLQDKKGAFKTEFLDGKKKKELILSDFSWNECSACGEKILDGESAKKVEEERYKALGLLSPQELKTIRKGLCMTQEQIAEFLNVGNKTYCRWENGTLMQSKSMDNLIRLAVRDTNQAQEKEKRIQLAQQYLESLKERRTKELGADELKIAAHLKPPGHDMKRAGAQHSKKLKMRG